MGNFYKLRTISEISEEVSLQAVVFLSVKYMGFCAFVSGEYFLPRIPLVTTLFTTETWDLKKDCLVITTFMSQTDVE